MSNFALPALAALFVFTCGALPAGAEARAVALEAADGAHAAGSREVPRAQTPPVPKEQPKEQPKDPPKEVPKELADARAALVTRLLELATWCNTAELFEDRDKIYKQVLGLQPENLEAHKGLHHVHTLNGTWKEEAKHDPKNRPNPKATAELPERRANAVRPFGEKVAALAKATSDAAAKQALCDEVLALDPDDAAVHEVLGQVRLDDRWVLPDTAHAKPRRAEIKAIVKDVLARVETPRTDKPTADEAAMGPAWKSVAQTKSVRVLSSVSEDEAAHIARSCEAAGMLAQAILGGEFPYPTNYTIFDMELGEKTTFLAHLPRLDDAERARLAKLFGTGIPNTDNVAVWDKEPPRRLDTAVRQTLAHLLTKGFGLKSSCGWAWEGFGLYLTRELIGTRLTWFVSGDAAEAEPPAKGDGKPASPAGGAKSGTAALRGRLLVPDSNWMNEALKLLTSEPLPKLEEILKRDLDHLGTADMVIGYALAAYLMEARSEAAADFLRRSAAGGEPAEVSKTALGMSVADLQARLTQWLSERR